jgi:hypothetical protein
VEDRRQGKWIEVLERVPTYDRTTINAWEDIEFRKAVGGTSATAHDMALRRIEQAWAWRRRRIDDL